MEGIAKPGQVLVTHATVEELGGEFPLSEPWSVEVKNIDEPVRVYSVMYEAEAAAEADATVMS
jgi:class 3 adenylate cyclase